jgi:hypothetical protein
MSGQKTGRPSKYGPEVVSEICSQLSEGRSLRSICEDENLPDKSTVLRWLAAYPDFRDQYARAREAQTDAMAEEILEIADESGWDLSVDDKGHVAVNGEAINRSRLRVDTRKWLMSKMAPKKYGDKIVQEHAGSVTFRHEDALSELE